MIMACVIMAENDLLFVHPFIFTGVHLGFFLFFFFLNLKDHPFFFSVQLFQWRVCGRV